MVVVVGVVDGVGVVGHNSVMLLMSGVTASVLLSVKKAAVNMSVCALAT